MRTYIALLRGINVGGKNKISMEELKELCIELGLLEVHTYIQSGNIVFKSSSDDCDLLAQMLHEAIKMKKSLNIEVLVLKPEVLKSVLTKKPFTRPNEEIYFTFLWAEPELILQKNIECLHGKGDRFFIGKNVIYIDCITYGKTKFTTAFFEKKLMQTATTRNYKTLTSLLEISNNILN